MSITETLKKTIDDLQLDQRAEALTKDLNGVYAQTLQQVGGYVSSREADITALIDKVVTSIDTRTEGRFAGEIGKVAGTVKGGVTRLAEQGPRDV